MFSEDHQVPFFVLRDGPLENLCGGAGGGGRGRSTPKKFAEGKIKWQKIRARQLILKKYSCDGLKKSNKEFGNEKKFLRLEKSLPPPPPPHNFSNGPSLSFPSCPKPLFQSEAKSETIEI